MKGMERKLPPPALKPSMAVYLQLTTSVHAAPAFLPALPGPNARKSHSACRSLHPLQAEEKWAFSCLSIYSEGGKRTGSILAGLWTLSYMPSIYGNDIPTGKTRPPEGRAPGLSIA